MAVPLINGKSYSYAKISVNILGAPVFPNSVTYDETLNYEYYYGNQQRPVEVGVGTIETSGSLELSMVDAEALRRVAPNGSLVFMPEFDIVVVFIDGGQNPVKHILKNARITTDGTDTTSGDTTIMKAYDIRFSHIEFKE